MNQYYVKNNGKLLHRPPLKIIINPILRFIQFWTNKPFVIASLTEYDINENPIFIKYVFKPVYYEKTKINLLCTLKKLLRKKN